MISEPPSLLFLVTILLCVSCRHAAPEPPPPSPRTGEEIFQSCLLCHSTKELQRGPILDGLPAWYVTLQLHKFQAGFRGSQPENRSELLMASGITSLQDTNEIERVAQYIAGLPPQKHLKLIKGDKVKGAIAYVRCFACHGMRGEGNRTLNSPPLNTLEDWYHFDQLIRFRAGLRGYHTNDVGGHAMRVAVQSMTNKEFRDIVRYVAETFAP